jgi:hypothetical protein
MLTNLNFLTAKTANLYIDIDVSKNILIKAKIF